MFYKVIKTLAAIVFSLFMPSKTIGKENIPKEGGFILALNHRSNFDVVFAAISCNRNLHFMAKKEIFKYKIVAWLAKKVNAFPVDRAGNDIKAIKKALSVLKDGLALCIFPEGTRVKEGESVDAKAGVSMLAIRTKVPVVPGAIVGEYKLFHKIHIIYGEPISLEEYYDSKPNNEQLLQISGEIMDKIKKMDKDAKKTLAKREKLR